MRRGSGSRRCWRIDRPRRGATTIGFPGRGQPAGAERGWLYRAHGAGGADARRRRWQLGLRILPGFGVAAGPGAAAAGAGGAVCVGLPDPADAGCQSGGWAERAGRRFHGSACLVPRSMCREPGWIGLDPTSGLYGGRGACSAGRHASAGVGGADHRGAGEVPRSRSSTTMEVRRVREEPRVTFPFTDHHWERIDSRGARDRPAAQRRAMCG